MLREEGPGWKFYLSLWFGLGLSADIVFGLIAWRKLQISFRQLAAARSVAASRIKRRR